MYLKTKGIVLHTVKYSETSVIAKIYTEKLGLVSYMVKGVRSAKSKAKAALLQPLTLLHMEVSHRENKQLQFIKEFRRDYTYQSIPFNMPKSAIALFLLEVISKSIREHEENIEMFEFIYDSLCALDKSEKLNPDFHLLFLIHFTRYLGFGPHGNFSDATCYFELSEGIFTANGSQPRTLDKRESELLQTFLVTNKFEGATLRITRLERQQMMKHLVRYYQLHIENFALKSPEILEELFN
jgi:DNA repair protein RecO (recombination protein O)